MRRAISKIIAGVYENKHKLLPAVASETVQHSKGKPWVVMCCLGFFAIALSAGGYKSYRTWDNEQQLKDLHAEYTWMHDSEANIDAQPSEAYTMLAKLFGNSLVSDFSSVKLKNQGLADGDLEFLADMRNLRRLELASTKVTDRTLEWISELPDLKYLSLGGGQYSFYGLLHLRNAHQLRQLRIDAEGLSPAELALLKKELPEVQLQDLGHEEESTRQLMQLELVAS